jgi:hypothetical protein
VRHLDGRVADGIRDLRLADDFAVREALDLELAVRSVAHVLRKDLGGAVDGVERLRKGRLQAPAHVGRGLRDCGSRDRRRGGAKARGLQELTTFHNVTPP